MTREVEKFEFNIYSRGSSLNVKCNRFWGHKSVIIHCCVYIGGKWETAFNFQDITGLPLIDLIVGQGQEQVNDLIKKELEKIRHTFKVYSEPGKRMYPDWKKGQSWQFS